MMYGYRVAPNTNVHYYPAQPTQTMPMTPSGYMYHAGVSQPAGSPMTDSGVPQTAAGSPITAAGVPVAPGTLPMEQSYIENILRLNLGKHATIYMTFEGNREWNAKIFSGILEAAGRDHIIISDPDTGKRYLLLMVNLDYITFDEELNYNLPFGSMTDRPDRKSVV